MGGVIVPFLMFLVGAGVVGGGYYLAAWLPGEMTRS